MSRYKESRQVNVCFIATLLAAVFVSACDREVVQPPERIRAVKTIVVAERATGQLRTFPGTVEPVDTSSITTTISANRRPLNAISTVMVSP